MALDFTKDINNVTRQIRKFLVNDEPVPKCTIEHYNNLAGAQANSAVLESGTSDFPTGDLASSFPAVTTTNSVVLAANVDRTYIVIQNIGADTVYINFDSPAAVGGGIQLLPGANWITQIPQFTATAINAIAESTSSTLAVYEIA